MSSFYIEGSDLGGTIPTEIGSLSNLAYFEIGFTKVSGSVPTEITKLTRLRQLHIDGPLFEGTLPNEVGSMIELGKKQEIELHWYTTAQKTFSHCPRIH